MPWSLQETELVSSPLKTKPMRGSLDFQNVDEVGSI